MKNRRVVAAFLAAALLTGSMPATFMASESQSETAVSGAEGETAEASSEDQVSAELQLQTDAGLPAAGMEAAGIRPSYTASDYVEIEDDGYRKLTIRLYPPAEDSEQAQADYKKQLDTDIMTQLYSRYPVTRYPQDLEKYVTQSLTSTYRQYAEMYGMDFGTFLSTYMGMDEDTFSGKAKEAADKTLKQELLLSAIAEKENIMVTDADYQQGLSDYAAKYGYESADALLADFDEATVRVSLLMDKTLDFLEKNNKIELIVETESEADTEAETTAAAGPDTES